MNVGFHFGGVVLHNVVIHPVGMESMYGDMSVVVYVILGIIVLCSIILFVVRSLVCSLQCRRRLSILCMVRHFRQKV